MFNVEYKQVHTPLCYGIVMMPIFPGEENYYLPINKKK